MAIEKIQATDTLNVGREKINNILDGIESGESIGENAINRAKITNKAINTVKISSEAISADKTSFLRNGRNLFNWNSVDNIEGKFAYYLNGNVRENDDYFLSHYMSIEIAQGPISCNIEPSKACHLCFYDNTYNYIGGLYKPTTFEIPTNATYMRFSAPIDIITEIQFEFSSQRTAVKPFGEAIKMETIRESSLIQGSNSSNLFNKENVLENIFVFYSDGELKYNEDFVCSDFIEVDPKTHYILDSENTHLVFYDAYKKYITGYHDSQLSVAIQSPENASFVRFGVKKTSIDTTQFYLGKNKRSYYIPGGVFVPESKIDPDFRFSLAYARPEMLVPEILYAKQDQINNIFWRNMISNYVAYVSTGSVVRVQSVNEDGSYYSFGESTKELLSYYPTKPEYKLEFRLFSGKGILLDAQQTILKCADSVANSSVKNILCIGDSYFPDGGVGQNTYDLLKSWNKNVTFLGKFSDGEGKINHEAVAGNATSSYMNQTLASGKPNRFFNSTTQAFDFKMYMNNNYPEVTVDIFVIYLGINDSTRQVEKSNWYPYRYTYIKRMVDSAKEHNPNMKIVIRLLNAQSDDDHTSWERTYGTDFMTEKRMKQMQEFWNKMIIDEISKLDNVYVSNDGYALDTKRSIQTKIINPIYANDVSFEVTSGTHPNEIGYKQLANVLAATIACII